MSDWPVIKCDGTAFCPAITHIHGCYSEKWNGCRDWPQPKPPPYPADDEGTSLPVVSLLEQRRDAHPSGQVYRDQWPIPDSDPPWCLTCDEPWPCPDRVALDAAVRLVQEAAEYLEAIRHRNAGIDGSIDDSPFDVHDAVAALALLVANPEPQETT